MTRTDSSETGKVWSGKGGLESAHGGVEKLRKPVRNNINTLGYTTINTFVSDLLA